MKSLLHAGPPMTVRFGMAYLKELDIAVKSIEKEPTYAASDIFEWMHIWGEDNEKPFMTKKSASEKVY